MFCSDCGSRIGANDKFCPSCGKAVNITPGPQASSLAQNQTVLHCTAYSAAPITYQSRLTPVLRHPLFFISALIFLAVSVYDLAAWYPVFEVFIYDLKLHILDFLRIILLMGSNLMVVVSLTLFVIGGLTNKQGPCGAALSLNVIALCLQLLSLVLRVPELLEALFYWYGYYSHYTFFYYIAELLLAFPVHLLMLIFALRANGIARAMNNGRSSSMGSGLPIMLLIHCGIRILVDLYLYYISALPFIYFLENTTPILLPALSFSILLLLKRKTK